jgi:hypothetical protein
MNATTSFLCRREPTEYEEVTATEGAAEGKEEPVKRLLYSVARAYQPEIDRLAVGTTGGEHT